MEPAEDGRCHDVAARGRLARGPADGPGDVLAQSLMRTRHVKVGVDVFPEYTTQVALAENGDVVEALAPDAAQEALADGRLGGMETT